MPLSDRRLPSATDDASAEPAPGVARGGAAAQGKRAARTGSAKAAEKSAAKSAARPAAKAADKPVDKLAKLGLTRDIDLVLHLPM